MKPGFFQESDGSYSMSRLILFVFAAACVMILLAQATVHLFKPAFEIEWEPIGAFLTLIGVFKVSTKVSETKPGSNATPQQ